jgi:hypothetical protein
MYFHSRIPDTNYNFPNQSMNLQQKKLSKILIILSQITKKKTARHNKSFKKGGINSHSLTFVTSILLSVFKYPYHRNDMSDTISAVYYCTSQCPFPYLS